ncbi:Fc receptor-like protein 6 [Acomys russatus]|uniref:Fc receptor-like protein 6 n=1 Tax=Acomys russatus TaxID=60746 RepID=UPI0021E1DBF5|nr:Fc receptor-like protein 6 [Acomys russatus]
MLFWMVLLLPVSMIESQELLQTPVLSRVSSPDSEDLILKCKAEVHPEKPDLQLFYSFYKNNRAILNRGRSQLLHIAEAKEEDSGLYQCMVATEDGRIQRESNYLSIPIQISHSMYLPPVPVLTLQHEATNLAVGDMVTFLCKTQGGSLLILYSFYLDGKIIGKALALFDRTASFPISVSQEWSAKNYSCEAKNKISTERSETKEFPLVGKSCPT